MNFEDYITEPPKNQQELQVSYEQGEENNEEQEINFYGDQDNEDVFKYSLSVK